MEKELIKIMEKYNDIAKATTKLCEGKVALGRVRSTSGFTGTELPRESSVEYKTFPTLSWGRSVDKVDVLTTAPHTFSLGV
jgi:hypothetical protein